MLPPIHYKMHPKALEIQEEKRRRKQILEQARRNEELQVGVLREERHKYIQQNQERILDKKQQIYERKLNQRNIIRQEDITRAERIANKRSELLMKLVPERRAMVESLRGEYLESIQKKDKERHERVKAMIEQKLAAESIGMGMGIGIGMEQKIKSHNLIDTNDGTCVICLSQAAQIYMVSCRHLVCCTGCQFMIRMNKKCPLCRAPSKYESINQKKRHKSFNLNKKTK